MKKRFFAAVLTAAMVIGALSGCGQSKTQKTDTALETEIAAEASEEETGYNEITQVRVAYMQNYASLWEVATAINKGYFEEQGLDIKLYAFQDGPTRSMPWNLGLLMWPISDLVPINCVFRDRHPFSVFLI